LPVAYRVIFTPLARAELIEAQDWYERQAPGLGRRFRQSIDALVERVNSGPLQFSVVYKSVRRALLRRFPYTLLFVIDHDTLLVIACFHASRDPAHWLKRT